MRSVLLLCLCFGFVSCTKVADLVPEENRNYKASLVADTPISKTLRQLPPAREAVTVSVYSFRDYTGQNKPGEVPQYSKAVTQGGLALLKKALLDAGNQSWFRVLERGGLEDLLQERKIIRSIRQQYRTPSGQQLPDLGPLLYSGLLLEGGIIAYESNVLTGGVGARYLGIGGSTEYRRDVVTISLRAVNVTSGQVMVAVNTSKTILSTAVQGGMFKFVSFDKLLESEAGLTINEPPQLAVRQAIEMGVYALIMEGAAKNIWSFKDPVAGLEALRTYVSTENKSLEIPSSLEQLAQKRISSAAGRSAVRAEAREKAVFGKIVPPTVRSTSVTSKPSVSVKEGSSRFVSTPKDTKPGWYFQVAAVTDFGPRELSILERYKKSGFPLSVQMAKVHQKRYFRLLIGPYPSKQGAVRYRSQIDRLSPEDSTPFLKKVS